MQILNSAAFFCLAHNVGWLYVISLYSLILMIILYFILQGELQIDSEIIFQLGALAIQATFGDFLE